MRITTYQPDTKSNPNPNPATKQHSTVNIQLNIVTCAPYPQKFIRDNVVAPFVRTSIVIVTLPDTMLLSTGLSRCETRSNFKSRQNIYRITYYQFRKQLRITITQN